MATTINKQRLLTQLLGHLQKAVDEQETRPVLQQFIFGLCRENATPEQAERAYRHLAERFYDWNEVRVSSLRELEEAFAGLSGAESRAQRLVSFLQEVFETTFSFDLEDLQKKGVKMASKQLLRYQAANDYVGSWVVQRTLGGHAIPLDESTLRCTRRLGLVDTHQEDLEGIRASLEHLLPKSKGPAFTDAISQVAEEFCHEERPRCAACPLVAECSHAQEHGVVASETRPARPKSR